MKPEYDAFISYSSHNKFWVCDSLLCELENAGLEICIDWRDFDLGIASLVNMERAVERSRKTILVLSPKWVESEWTNFESLMLQTRSLLELEDYILPVLFERCQIPLRLRVFTYADFTSPEQWGTQMKRLIANIKEARKSGPCVRASFEVVNCESKAEILYTLSFEGECERINSAAVQQIEAVLQKYSKDVSLRIRRIDPGSVVLEIIGTREGYYRLHRLLRLGLLDELVGIRFIGISAIADGKEAVAARIKQGITVIPVDYKEVPLAGVICRSDYIEGFEAEYEGANKLLPGKTDVLSDVVIYVTAQGTYYYAQSNYVIAGHSHPSKMCSTDIPDLFYIFIYMVGKDWPPPEEEQRLYEIHVNKVKYIINEKIMMEDGWCEIDFYDATKVTTVKDIP